MFLTDASGVRVNVACPSPGSDRKKAVKPISRSQYNDGYGADSGPSRAILVGALSAQLRMYAAAICYVRFTSKPAKLIGFDPSALGCRRRASKRRWTHTRARTEVGFGTARPPTREGRLARAITD